MPRFNIGFLPIPPGRETALKWRDVQSTVMMEENDFSRMPKEPPFEQFRKTSGIPNEEDNSCIPITTKSWVPRGHKQQMNMCKNL